MPRDTRAQSIEMTVLYSPAFIDTLYNTRCENPYNAPPARKSGPVPSPEHARASLETRTLPRIISAIVMSSPPAVEIK